MSQQLIDDCFRPGQEFLRHDEAVALLKARIRPIAVPEFVRLAAASGRVIAEAAVARSPVPAHTNSAVDGYAFLHAGAAARSRWAVAGRSAAGHPFAGRAGPDQAVRIFTGAVMPEGTDSVIMQEDTRPAGQGSAGGGEISFNGTPKAGANVRKAGEDVASGEVLLDVGQVIRPQDLAGLASIGLGEVACFQRLRVAVVSTGDEVVAPGARGLLPGEVYDANAGLLQALAASAGCEVTHLGIVPDRADAVRETLADAATRFDVILTSGGASRGEEDHIAACIGALGTRHFWQIQIKPGRPMMLGQIGDVAVVGLPGNPVAVFVCFLMYVWPMLRRLGGGAWPEPRRFQMPADFEFPKRKVGRREFWRGMMRPGPAGDWRAVKFERDGSGLISSLRAADCLIDIPEDVTGVSVGDPVAVIPFSEFGIVS